MLLPQGHLPGAVFFNWTRDGIDDSDAVPAQLQIDPGLFAAAAEARGVSSDRPVVVYDAGAQRAGQCAYRGTNLGCGAA